MFIELSRQERENRILTLQEWINIVKQLGMMHVVYYIARRCYHHSYVIYKTFGHKPEHKNWELTLYKETNTEKKLIDCLDLWEKQYRREWRTSESFLNAK